MEANVERGFNNKDEDGDPYEVSDPETIAQFVEAENR